MPDGNNSEECDSAKQWQQNIIENSHITTWFFDKCFNTFFCDVLIKQWDLEDFWYRYEWQHRGSIHVHKIGKRKNAPKIEWTQIKENENEMRNVIQYIDSIVTTNNPGIFTSIPEWHPCQKCNDEIEDDL